MFSAVSFRAFASLLVGFAVFAFVIPAFATEPPLGDYDVETKVADGPSYPFVGKVGPYRLDTTLINDIDPPTGTDPGPVPPLDDDDQSQYVDKSFWESFPDPRQAAVHCESKAASARETAQCARCRSAESILFGSAEILPPPCHSATGPCGSEFAGPAVHWPPHQHVYGDVLHVIHAHDGCADAGDSDCSECPFGRVSLHVEACADCDCKDACPGCKCKKSDSQKTARVVKHKKDLRRGEAAEVILGLIDRVGPSVLNGTLFEDGSQKCIGPDCDGAVPSQRARELVVDWIRKMESEQPNNEKTVKRYQVIRHAKPHRVVAKQVEKPNETVHALRYAAHALDDAAESLEHQSLYQRADQLRGLAQQLRSEGRDSTGSSWEQRVHRVHPPIPPRPSGPELEDELERLRHELERTRDALQRQWHDSRRYR